MGMCGCIQYYKSNRSFSEASHSATQTSFEGILLGIWDKILRFGDDSNFLEAC